MLTRTQVAYLTGWLAATLLAGATRAPAAHTVPHAVAHGAHVYARR